MPFWARVLRRAQAAPPVDDATAEWNRREAPLLALDPEIERFARTHGFAVTKNLKDWPERSLHRAQPLACLIQIYLDDPQRLTWKLWVCAWQDREGRRYWRRETLIGGAELALFQSVLADVLGQGKRKLDEWCAQPETLEPVA